MKTTTSERLKELMMVKGLRQVDILNRAKPYCEKYGIKLNKSDLSQFVSGKTEPGQWKLTVLAMALNVSEAWLMGLDVPMERYNHIDNLANVIPFPQTTAVPIIGKIACGEPILAEQNIDGSFQAPTAMKATFCLKCKGDSMIEAGIFDGDIVFIREQPEIENGQIAAVQIEDDADQPSEMFATLKKVYRTDNTLLLMPMNQSMKVKEFKGNEIKKVRILGKYVGLTRLVD